MIQPIQDFLLQLQEVVRHIGWGEVVDVAVVAFVLYQVLRLLRGTQGIQILVGLVLLGVVGVLATQLNLVLLSWLFRNAGFFILIAVIVMFQPELRRAMDQLGRLGHIGLPLTGYSTRLYSQAISEAIRAATLRKLCGAVSGPLRVITTSEPSWRSATRLSNAIFSGSTQIRR